MDNDRKIEKLKVLYDRTLNLISLYRKNDFPIPFSLKGNLGEFIVAMELLKRFPQSEINYRGGAFPGIDISVDEVKIQVKTHIKQEPKIYKKNGYGSFDFECSPTIKKSSLKKCDCVVLVILYPHKNFSKIENTKIYIFNRSDFKHFNTKFCWSGKSKGDFTIVHCLRVEGSFPPKAKEIINFYNTPQYKKLFQKSLNNWNKVGNLL